MKINKIDQLKGQWFAGAQLSPQILGRLKKSVLITSSGASTRIEGARLEDEDVEKLMAGLSMQKFTDRDKQEVRGYYELLSKVFESWKHVNFSESMIKHFHKELLQYVNKDVRHRGDYKKAENRVVAKDGGGRVAALIFDTTSAYLAPKETQELVDWTIQELKDEKYHPLLVIGNFLVEFLKIHPFQDGNGRLSRILTNLLLLKAGYSYMPYASHEKLIEENKTDYYIALRRSQKTFNTKKQDISVWLNFFFDVLIKQSQIVIELLSEENIEKLLSKKQLSVWEYLNSVDDASAGEISEKTNVARPTVNQVLDKLLAFKKIERMGQGRSTRYKVK
jgi:Fic family protein